LYLYLKHAITLQYVNLSKYLYLKVKEDKAISEDLSWLRGDGREGQWSAHHIIGY
jgi:hypothetical protein